MYIFISRKANFPIAEATHISRGVPPLDTIQGDKPEINHVAGLRCGWSSCRLVCLGKVYFRFIALKRMTAIGKMVMMNGCEDVGKRAYLQHHKHSSSGGDNHSYSSRGL